MNFLLRLGATISTPMCKIYEEDGGWMIKTYTILKTLALKFKVNFLKYRVSHKKLYLVLEGCSTPKFWARNKSRGCFGILRFSAFQNCPYFWLLAQLKLRYLRLKTPGVGKMTVWHTKEIVIPWNFFLHKTLEIVFSEGKSSLVPWWPLGPLVINHLQMTSDTHLL